MAKNNVVYNEQSIQVLQGLEAVRKRPVCILDQLIQGTSSFGFEIVDNSIDEVLAGYGNKITVQINPDNSIEVTDNGRGIPIGKHKTGKSTQKLFLPHFIQVNLITLVVIK